MKIVLRNTVTGLYYDEAGRWVRRADNALTFENAGAAREYCRDHHLQRVQPVQRLAPYMRDLLRKPAAPAWQLWNRGRINSWYVTRAARFSRN